MLFIASFNSWNRKRCGFFVYLAYQMLDNVTHDQMVGESINRYYIFYSGRVSLNNKYFHICDQSLKQMINFPRTLFIFYSRLKVPMRKCSTFQLLQEWWLINFDFLDLYCINNLGLFMSKSFRINFSAMVETECWQADLNTYCNNTKNYFKLSEIK